MAIETNDNPGEEKMSNSTKRASNFKNGHRDGEPNIRRHTKNRKARRDAAEAARLVAKKTAKGGRVYVHQPFG